MRVHLLRLENFKGVASTEVRFCVPGVTIVEGDNEVGKSSIPEALHLLIDYPDSSRAAAVKAVQPVGRDVGAVVEADISCGPYRFTYRKRWHRDTETVLSLTEPQVAHHTGRAAHDRVKAILDEVLDADLFAALQLTQGSGIALPRFTTPSLGRALDLAAGAPLHGEHDALWDRVEAEFLRYWTPSGQARKERTALQHELAEARTAHDHAVQALAQLDHDALAAERLGADLHRLRARRDELRARCAQIEGRVRQAEEARTRRDHLQVAVDLAAAERRELLARSERRRDLSETLARLAERVGATTSATEALADQISAARTTHRDATAAASRLDAAARDAAEATAQAEAVHEHLRVKAEIHQIDTVLERHQAAADRMSAAARLIDGAPVDEDLVDHLDALTAQLHQAEATARVGAPTVTVTPHTSLVLSIDGTEIDLVGDHVHHVPALSRTDITLPGVATFTIDPGSHAEDAQRELADLRERLEAACRDAGVSDLAAARRRLTEVGQAAHELELAAAEQRSALGGVPLDQLERRRTALLARADRPAPEGADATDLAGAVVAADAARAHQVTVADALDAARTEVQRAAQVLHELDVLRAGSSGSLQSLSDEVARCRADLDALVAELSDEDLASQLDAAAHRHADAVAAHAAAESDLEIHHPDDLLALLDTSTSSAERNDLAITQVSDELTHLRASLEVRGESGLHDRVDQAATRVAHLEHEVDALERRAAAARLLATTMDGHRSRVRRQHVAPFTDRLNRLARVVFGPQVHIEVDEALSPSHRTLDGIRLPVDQLSVGAREQIGVLARLACATLVSDEGGAPVILDDALGWSDPDRLSSMGAAIGLAGADAQVIVLTCTPERYATAGSAHVVTMRRPAPAVPGERGTR
ncbi:MAG: hypothetical protein ACXIVQ_01145 [Acidimicrobiales bacterium]